MSEWTVKACAKAIVTTRGMHVVALLAKWTIGKDRAWFIRVKIGTLLAFVAIRPKCASNEFFRLCDAACLFCGVVYAFVHHLIFTFLALFGERK
jgi:hypothetical protein